MSSLIPLTVAIPLLSAAAIAAGGRFVAARVANLAALAAASAVTVISTILLVHSATHTSVHWFGGWRPRHGVAIGVAFAVDPLGVSLAAFAALLMCAALVFSWSYFDRVGPLFYTLMLGFLAGLVGFALTGDLFNLFVFFELMSVSAYALTGYRIREEGALQGALNLAITNSIGAFLVALAIALVYGRTGALNMAQAGEALARQKTGGLVIAALVLFTVGFLVKAGAVPFHFWLSDAYAVAPAPVGVLLTGVMSDLGYHAVARVYSAVFSAPTAAHADAVRGMLIGAGLVTALLGAVMALLQADLRRLLAFVTVSHGGIFLIGIALLRARGLAGSALYVVADGAFKAAFFLVVAIVVIRLGSGDELALRGRGHGQLILGALFALCGLGFAGLPPFGPFLAKSLIDEAARGAGFGWIPPLVTLATLVTAAAVFRAAGRIFLGLGAARDELLTSQPEEPEEGRESPRFPLFAPVIALLVVGFGLAFVPGIAAQAERQAARFQDRAGYVAEVLRGEPPRLEALPREAYRTPDWIAGAVSAAGAVGLAALLLRRPAAALHAVHSGAVGDYAVWICAGAAAFSVVWTVTLR